MSSGYCSAVGGCEGAGCAEEEEGEVRGGAGVVSFSSRDCGQVLTELFRSFLNDLRRVTSLKYSPSDGKRVTIPSVLSHTRSRAHFIS